MDSITRAKFLAAGVLLASVFALVILGKVDAGLYVQIVLAGLAGLGVHAARGTPSDPASSPPPNSSAVTSLTLETK